MKKICFLIFSCILLTGCNAEYNLTYENNKLTETLSIISEKNTIIDGQDFKSIVDNYYNNNYIFVDYQVEPGDMIDEYLKEYDIYNKNLINNNEKYGLNLNYEYQEKNEYSNSTIAYSLFENLNINDNYIRSNNIKNVFKIYPNLENINITFKTDKKVLNTNADEVENDIYYWNINKNNYSDKRIEIEFENNSQNKQIIDQNISWNIIYTIIGILGITLLIAGLVIYEKIKNSNK